MVGSGLRKHITLILIPTGIILSNNLDQIGLTVTGLSVELKQFKTKSIIRVNTEGNVRAPRVIKRSRYDYEQV